MANKYWWEEHEQSKQEEQTQQTKQGYWWDDGSTASKVGTDITNRVNTWLKNHNNYVRNFQTRTAGRKYTFEDDYVNDPNDWLTTVSKQKKNFDAEADSILSYMEQYKGYLDADWMKSVQDTLAGARDQQRIVAENAAADSKWWSNFANEDEYKTAQRYDGYNQKYQGQKYEDIQKALSTLEDGSEEKWWLGEKQYDLYQNDRAYNSKAMSGLKSFEAQKVVEQEQEDEKTWFEKALASFATTGDTTLPAANLTTVTAAYSNDTSWREPTEEWSDGERREFGYRYAEDPEKAYAYAEQVNRYYMDKAELEAQATAAANASNNFWSGAANTVGAIASAPLGIGLADYLDDLAQASARGRIINDGTLSPNEYFNAATSGIANKLNEKYGTVDDEAWMFGGKGLGDIYSLGVSGAQSVASSLAFGGPAKMAGKAMGLTGKELAKYVAKEAAVPTLVQYFGMSGASSIDDALSRGATADQAILYGTIMGAMEGAAEALSVDNLLKVGSSSTFKNFLRSSLNQGLGELQEEGATSAVDLFVDHWIMADKSKFSAAVKNYTDKGMNEKDAKKKALLDMAGDVAFDALGGFATGFANATLTGGVNTGLDARRGNVENINAIKEYGDRTDELIQEGLESDKKSESYKLAQKYQQQVQGKDGKEGKAMTGFQIRNLLAANQEQITPKDLKTIQKAAETRLTELGQTEDVEKIAELATKFATGGKLTKSERRALAVSDFGSRVSNELLPKNIASGEYTTEWAEEIGTKQVNYAAYNKKELVRQIVEGMVNQEVSTSAQYKSLTERVGTEGRFGVSESGQATIRATNKVFDFENAEVAEVGNGQMFFKREDGGKVSAGGIDFVDDSQSFLVSAVSDIENITPDAATEVMHDIVDMNKPLGLQLNGIDEAFTYGFNNYSVEDMKAGDFTKNLTDAQMMRVYELGQAARKISDVEADAPVVKMRTAMEATVSEMEKVAQQKARFESDDVEVYFLSKEDGSISKFNGNTDGYDDRRTTTIRGAQILSKMRLGGSGYYLYESYVNDAGERVYKDANGVEKAAPNGIYTANDGRIYIDLNAGEDGQGVGLYTLSHELTHFIKDKSKKQFKILGDLVTEAFDKSDVSMHQRVMNKQALLSDNRGEAVSYTDAYEEVVCDAMSTMISDGNFFERVAEIKVKDRSLFETMKRFFKKIFAKFKEVYESLTPDQKDAQDIRAMKDMFDRIQQAFAEALVEASDNFHAAMESVVETKAEPVAAGEILTDGAVVTDGEGERFSIRSMKHDIAEGKMFEDLKNVCGWTDAQVNVLRNQLKDLVEYMIPYRDILDMNETYGREGRRFSPYKPNSDPLYKISMDFSTLCSKRLLTQFVIENLQLRENRPMSAEEQMAIRDMLNEYRKVEKGLQVACAMCYVEAARLKSPKQMQRWLDDPAPLLKDYFGKKNKEFNDSVKKAQADFKESKGYDREAPKKDMKPADVKELNKIGPRMRSQYQVSAEEAKVIERAKALPNSTYLTAGNLAALSESDPVIYDAYTAFVRTATRSKSLETDEPYYYGDSARDNGNGIVVTDSFIEAVNRENGMRFSSWSDWRIQHLLDYITAVIDNSVRGAAMHGYTKFGDEVRVLGKTGMMFNMSGVAGTQNGLNEDGSLNFSGTESIDVNEAIQLRKEFPETAGLQCIGVSDDHIVELLRSDIIDYVIPYHVSGLNAALRRMANIHGWDDYTGTQHASIDKSIKLDKAVDKEHWHEEPVFSEFFVGYDTGMTGIQAMRASAEKYKQLCKDRGLTPKFNQFASEKNYWKLLIDRKMINQVTGKLIEQKAVTPTFDFEVIKSVVDKFVDNYDAGLEARALNHIVENWDSIPQRIKDLKKQGGTKANKTKKAVKTLANQTVVAQVKESSRTRQTMRDIDIDRTFINYGDTVAEQAAIDAVVASLVSRGKFVKINRDNVKKHGTNGKWVDWQAAREYLKGILEKFMGSSVYFAHNKQYAEAYLTRAGVDHSAGGVITAERAEIFDQFKKLVQNAEYAFSSKNDIHSESNKKISGKIDWDCFVAVAKIGEEPYPVVFKIRTIDRDVRSQIHEMSMKKEANGSHDPGQQNEPLGGMSTYGVAPSTSGDKVTQPKPEVNKNSDRLSERTNAPTFYSQMGKVVEGMKQEKFGASSVISMLRGRGVKAEEIRWSGIQPFLEGKKSVTKAELMDFIKGSMLHIEEKVLGETIHYTEEQQERLNELERESTVLWDEICELWVELISPDFTELFTVRDPRNRIVRRVNNRNLGGTDKGKRLIQIADALEKNNIMVEVVVDNAKMENPVAKWSEYKLDGGENYRELVFKMPGSTYTNHAMKGHWGIDAQGVLAHARMQDFEVDGKKMLFIEEIQSDWHNAGHKNGYGDLEAEKARIDAEYDERLDALAKWQDKMDEYNLRTNEYGEYIEDYDDVYDAYMSASARVEDSERRIRDMEHGYYSIAQDAPFKENYHEFVLKRLIRMAAEEGYDSIGWTTAQIQSDRWSDEYAEGYRIEYDQDIPKFLKKYGKQWGATVGKTNVGAYVYDIPAETEAPSDMDDDMWLLREDMRIEEPGTEVWSMDITPAMKNSVLTEGQAMYSERTGDSVSNRHLLANAFEGIVQNSVEYKMLQDYRGHIKELNELEEKLSGLNAEIRKIRFGTEGARDAEKLARLEDEAKKTAQEINRYDKRLLNMEASEPLRKVIDRERKKEAQKTKAHVQEIQQNKKVRAEQAELRHKIRKAVRDLDKILKHGNKQKNVKEDLQPVVTKALRAADILFTDNYGTYDMLRNGLGVDLSDAEEELVNTCTQMLKDLDKMPTDGYDNWQAREAAESKLKIKMSKLKDVFARERKRLNNTTVSSILGELADAYASLEKSEQSYVQGAYSEAVHNFLKSLQIEVGGTIVKDMTKDQLESVYAAYKMVLTTVRTANNMFNEELKMSREQLANAVIAEVIRAGGEHGLWTKAEIARSQADWNNTKPIWVANRIGSDTFGKLMNGLFKGQYNFAVDIEEAKQFKLKMDEKYHPRKWDAEKLYEFDSSTGKKFSLNLQQIMSLYAFSKRGQAYSHLLNGGFVFEGNSTVIVDEKGRKKTYIHNGATSYKLNEATLNSIIKSLTKDQKAYVDEMQAYLSDVMGAKGNEVSMKLYGIKMFNEQFYFPLRSSGAYMERAKEAELKKQQGQINLVNSGFTHAVKPEAKNPIILSGFMDVWSEHCNEMSMYHSMVLPMEDFRKVYNYSTVHDDKLDSASVYQSIQDAYGKAATDYIDQLYRELNAGATVDPRETPFKTRISKFKKAAVMLSASVVVQQFSSVGRAYALIDPKYFIGTKVKSGTNLSVADEMKKYAPVAIIKEMGGFDTGTKGSAKSYIMAEKYGKGERIQGLKKDEQYRSDLMGILPAKADEKTWCAIWEAVKRETKAKHPKMDVKSEQFLKLAGERFSEVVEKTQVYDSVLARSANMRSKSAFMQMATSFMAEPTTTVNLLEDAIRSRSAKKMARAFGAVAVSIVLNNALASVVYAMRDDDEDETFIEKYFQSFASGMIDDINPMSYYPFLKDVYSLFQGYDVERADMSVIADVRDALKKSVSVIGKYDPDMDEDELAEYWKNVNSVMMSLLDAGCSAFGVPVKNVRRDVNGIINAYNTIQTDLTERDTTWMSFWDKVGAAAKDTIPIYAWTKDRAKQDKLYEAIISGDKQYLARMKSGYKTDSAYQSAVRKALRENDPRIQAAAQAKYEGNSTEYKRIFREIQKEGRFSFDDIMSAINSEENAIGPDKVSSEYSTADFVEAIALGNLSNAQAMMDDIIATKVANGKTQEEAEKAFASDVSTGIKNAFAAGLLDEAEAEKLLTEYAGKDVEEAAEKVSYWAFCNEHPEYDLTESNVNDYFEFAEPAEIPLDVFVQYLDGTKDLGNKYDEWGDVEVTKKEQVLEVINSLPLTWQQKDALYLAAGYAENKIWDVPW